METLLLLIFCITNVMGTAATMPASSLKGDATAKDESAILKIITADKEADEKRNDRTIYLGDIIVAWGDLDKDGDDDADGIVTGKQIGRAHV